MYIFLHTLHHKSGDNKGLVWRKMYMSGNVSLKYVAIIYCTTALGHPCLVSLLFNHPYIHHFFKSKNFLVHIFITYQSQSVCEVWQSPQPLFLLLYRDSGIRLSSWDKDDRERSTSQPQQ